jgi:hypothetical protein
MKLTIAQRLAVEPYIPEEERRAPGGKGGRPWQSARDVLDGVLWVLRTGAPWGDLPKRYPPYQTCHRRFQRWVEPAEVELPVSETGPGGPFRLPKSSYRYQISPRSGKRRERPERKARASTARSIL